MFPQTGGGGKGSRPQSTHQQQQQHNASGGGGAALQLSAAASSGSVGGHGHQQLGHQHGHGHGHGHGLGHGHGHAGVLTPSNSNTNLARALNNTALPPHFQQSAGLIAPPSNNAPGGAATYISTAYLPFTTQPLNPLMGMPTTAAVAFPTNGSTGAPAAAFYATAPPPPQPQQNQLQPAGQQQQPPQQQVQAPAAGQPQPIYYVGTSGPGVSAQNHHHHNNNGGMTGGNISHRAGGAGGSAVGNSGALRTGGQRAATAQHTNFFTYLQQPSAPQRPALVNNPPATAVGPIMTPRSGAPSFHMPQAFVPGIPIATTGGLTTAPLLAPTGMSQSLAAPHNSGPGGLHAYAQHLQSASAPGLTNVATVGVTGGFSATAMSTAAPGQVGSAACDKMSKRRYAIPIIHPDTKENVLDPNSSVFIKKDSNCTLTPCTALDSSDSTMCLYKAPTLMSVESESSLVSGVMVDQEMQTVKASPNLERQSISAEDHQSRGLTFGDVDSIESSTTTTTISTDKDQISVIVKDILAHSGNAEEHLSFLQYSDVDNATENHVAALPQVHKELNLNEFVESSGQSQAVQFKESKKQRPKSANKQSTATPTSIANDVAEAAASGCSGNTILPRSHQMQASTTTTSASQQQAKEQKQQQQQQQPQSQRLKGSTTANAAAGGAVGKVTQPTGIAAAARIAAPAATLVSGATSNSNNNNNNSNNKKIRKAQKRARELEKKNKKSSIPNTSIQSANSSNNNNTTTTTTTTTDKLSATSNNNPSISSSLRDNKSPTPQPIPNTTPPLPEQPKEQTTTKTTTNNICELNEDTSDCCQEDETIQFSESNSKEQDDEEKDTTLKMEKQHMATDEIVAKFLQKSCSSESPSIESESPRQQLQFLNSSSSVCEDEDATIKTTIVIGRSTGEDGSAVGDLKFGDFNEEPRHETGFICSSTWSSSVVNKSPPPVAAAKSPDSSVLLTNSSSSSNSSTTDHVDCSPKQLQTAVVSGLGSKKSSPVHQAASIIKQKSPQSPEKSQCPSPSKVYKYTIDELRELSKLTESRKPPMVPCQKGDCIAQLFVSRQQQQPQSHHGHVHSHHIQQYQHMNFNESLDYVPGKRGRNHGHGSNKNKHHDVHQQLAAAGLGNPGAGGILTNLGANQRNMDIIRVQLSLKEEIKLSECENAWQPETLRRTSTTSNADEDENVEAVLKKVRGILNKLTPDNFDVLLKEMSSIKMDNEAKMTNVMLLIFEKTISEPNFAPTYARFCKVLFHEIKAENKSLFTSSLITRIQHEFESNVNDANAKAKKLQPTMQLISECTDVSRKSELRAEMEDLEYQFRRRAWGTVRFIGELFKLQSLTSDRVLHCIESLLEHGCEEKLEYMCKLLTTVGHLLESSVPEPYQSRDRIERIFRRIQDIVNRSRGTSHRQQINIKISSRVRFMMQDVLDLRIRNWDQPNQPTSGQSGRQQQRHKQQVDEPKDHGQQHHHAVRGGQQQQQQSHQQQKHHHHGHDGTGGNYFLQKMPKQQQHENQTVSIDPSKLRFSSSTTNDESTAKLGNSSHYQWRNAGNRPVNASPAPTPTSLLKRLPTAPTAGQQNQNQGINFSQYRHPPPPLGMPLPKAGRNINPETTDPGIDDKKCKELVTQLIEEAMDTRAWQPEVMAIWRTLQTKQQIAVLRYLLIEYLHMARVSRLQRQACAKVFIELMRTDVMEKTVFTQAYIKFGDDFPDVLVDVPNGWAYVFEFLGPIMHAKMLDFKDVWQRRWHEKAYFTERFVAAFVNYFVQEFGAGYARKLWLNDYKLDRGQMFWSDTRQFRDFVQSHGYHFLEPNYVQHTKVSTQQRTPTEHVERIAQLMGCSSDMAIDYINTNVAINTNFVRQLTKFLCCDFALTVMASPANTKPNNTNNNNKKTKNNSVKPLQLNMESFRNRCTPLLRLCIDAQEAHEIACIDATVDSLQQHFMAEMEDEIAAGETICNTFSILYDSEVIPKESFDKWYKLEIEHSSNYRRPFIDRLRMFIEDM
ncbi:uncharacterized protein Dwil_GK11981 [Drosophila willistoni]|uniref:MI domain-containing protein n=1 Tax=Drosophila willistoni TaxID=7260 RepID=B4N831_DROWI|nr:uncharacterized protein Dwil_GK11981 [Drosophila willistoni]